MRWLVVLLVAAGALALVGTLTHSAVVGWLGVVALLGSLAAYVFWRREVRRTKYSRR